MGKGIVDILKKEFPINDEWLPFELHPETPEQGILLADYFPGMEPENFFNQLNARGKDVGIRFGPQTLLSNSGKALEGGEFAKTQGKYKAFHEEIFHAFFTRCQDIGNQSVLLGAAEKAGLNTEMFSAILESGAYQGIRKQTTQAARENGIRVAPTFIINDKDRIVGAQSIEKFRLVLEQAIGNHR